MKIDLRLLGIILLCVFAFSVVGCFLRREQDEDEPEDITATVVSVNPASGSTIPANATITVTFDNPPTEVITNVGAISVAGKIATITGPFATGTLALTITWADGQQVITYTVPAPEPKSEPEPDEPEGDTEPPKIIDSTISNGDTDVDPILINNIGKIEFLFSEEVTGSIRLQAENGADLRWIASIKGDKGILQRVNGRKLNYEAVYSIKGKISDAAGNETNLVITFTTAPKPDTTPPRLMRYILPGWNSTNVNTETVNNVGKIEIIFDEEVTGDIALQTENGDEVGWIGSVRGKSAILELVNDKELLPKTKYIITLKVSDPAGNEFKDKRAFETTGGPPPVLEGMVRIPAGKFRMGSDGVDAEPLEKPVHVVHLDAFYIDEHEVTNAQYKAFILENPQWQKGNVEGNHLKHWNENNYPPGKDDHPVTYVSWYAAMAYAEWAGKRLPTEAEWEKAARGKFAGRKYPWGNVIDRNKANYNDHIKDTRPVGSYPANDYGLYDMTGNVWEWCLDEAIPDFYAHSPPNNPIAGGPLKHIIDNFRDIVIIRIIRGGGWAATAANARVSYRSGIHPPTTSRELGFRCVFTP